MSDQTEAKQEYPTQVFVTIAGNHPMAEAALGSVLSTFFNDLGVAGRRQDAKVFDAKYAVDTVNGLAANQQNTINIMTSPLTMESMRGEYKEWDWPTWGDASQPWTALVNDSLRNMWSMFTSAQKRAIYESFNELNIQVEGEDEPLTLESALRIVHEESETYVRFNPNRDRTAFGNATVDGSFLDQAELQAILFVLNNAVPGTDEGDDEPRLRQQQTEVVGDVQPAPELEQGDNPAQNGAHAAPELPDGREVPDVDAPVADPASPEHNPEHINLTDGVPTVKSTDPVLAPVSNAEPTDALTLAEPPTSGSVVQPSRDSVED